MVSAPPEGTARLMTNCPFPSHRVRATSAAKIADASSCPLCDRPCRPAERRRLTWAGQQEMPPGPPWPERRDVVGRRSVGPPLAVPVIGRTTRRGLRAAPFAARPRAASRGRTLVRKNVCVAEQFEGRRAPVAVVRSRTTGELPRLYISNGGPPVPRLRASAEGSGRVARGVLDLDDAEPQSARIPTADGPATHTPRVRRPDASIGPAMDIPSETLYKSPLICN